MFAIFSFVAVFYGCSTSRKATGNLPELRLKDVSYGSFASSKMDITLPANRNVQTPFVIIIHGGAWVLGDKIWGSRTQDTLLAHGIASANINYRFADDDKIHVQELLADVDSVILYCASHAKQWNTRKDNFIINGESAGAHLSLMYGYTTARKISAIISECAPTNLSDTTVLNYYANRDTSLLHAICKMVGAGYTPGRVASPAFADASPVSHVKNIPTLFFHGTTDVVVPYSQATDLEKKLKDKRYTYQFIPMVGANHDLGLNVPESRAAIYKEIVDWVWKYGK